MPQWPLTHKKIILRADLNVPLEQGTIQDTFRLERAQSTLNFLTQRDCKTIIITHISRPKYPNEKDSTKNLLPWFNERYSKVFFASTLGQAQELLNQIDYGSLVLLENIRFWPQEHEKSQTFAYELKKLGSLYVNDAFGLIHRENTSITLLPSLFQPSCKTIGFLMQEEIKAFDKLLSYPYTSRIIIMGGAKIATKIAYIPQLLSIAHKVLICPPLSFCFERAKGNETGKSLVDESSIDQARHILDTHKNDLILPLDYQVEQHGKYSFVANDQIPRDSYGIAFGSKTLAFYAHYLQEAKSLFFNAPMGFLDAPATLHMNDLLLQEINQASTYSIAGGGDTVATIHYLNRSHAFTFLSTGGGAALAYLAGNPLKALQELNV